MLIPAFSYSRQYWQSSGCVCTKSFSKNCFENFQQRFQIFTKHLERQTTTPLPAASENIYPTSSKGLYLYLDISMIVFFSALLISSLNYLQVFLSNAVCILLSVNLHTSFSYKRKMDLLKKKVEYVSKNYNKANCRCVSKNHSRLNMHFFSKHFMFQLAAINHITNPQKNTYTSASKFHAESILKMRGFFLRLYMDRLNISRFY